MPTFEQTARPERLTFARHETFHLREGWLTKGLRSVGDGPESLERDGAHHDLGVGINMLRSIKYWLRAFGLASVDAERGRAVGHHLTALGELLLDQDPYLEDAGTLWLLQSELSSNRSAASFW